MNKPTNVAGLDRGFKHLIYTLTVFALLSTFGVTCHAQTQIFPQLTDGGGWRMAIVLENTTATATTASLDFYQDTANGATTLWNPPFLQTSNTQNIPIPAGGTVYLSTSGTAAALSQGWGQLTGNGVVGYAIYTLESYAGRPDQDGTSQATAAASRILVPFDCTTGFSTGFALVNPTGSAESISVNIETDAGEVIQTSLPSLPANGQVAMVTATQFPATAGHRGMAEFYVSSGSISIAAFRFNPTLALTSLPTFPQTGSPIIGGGGSSTGTLPQFGEIDVTAAFSTGSQTSIAGSITTYASLQGGGGYGLSTVNVVFETTSPLSVYGSFQASFANATFSGQTLTMSGIEAGSSSVMFDAGDTPYPITSGSIAVTFAPNGGPGIGSVTGTFTIASSLTTLTGTIAGTYSAQ